jgi:hypothetical protein
MNESLPPSKHLYQIVGIARDSARTILMTGMELEDANSAREKMALESEFVWFKVERESE